MNILYQDSFVEVTDQEMVFHRYYFPFGSDKRVPLGQIEGIHVRQPSLWGGSWRIWGTGDFQTWFPCDGGRPGRDRIFIAHLRNSSRRIGFTVENSQKFIEILKGRGLLWEISLESKSAPAGQETTNANPWGNRGPIIALALSTAAYVVFVAGTTPLLPPRVAIHFAGNGVANNWMARAQAILFFECMAGVPVLFIVLALLMKVLPAGSINLPNRNYWLSPDRRDQALTWASRQTAWMGCLIVLLLAGVFWLTILANEAKPARLPMNFFLPLLGAFVAATGIWTLCFVRHYAKPSRR